MELYSLMYLAGEDIACDVDEVLWPDPNRRQDPWAHVCTIAMIFCVYSVVFFQFSFFCFNWIHVTVMYSAAMYNIE